MASDNGNSRDKTIRRIIRRAAGETAEHIAANPEPEHQVTPQEMEAVQALLDADPELPAYVDLKVLNGFVINHPVQEIGKAVVMRALGIADETFFEGAIRHLLSAVSSTADGKADIRELNHAISLVASVAPRDQLETMLAMQMASVHLAAMTQIRAMNMADNPIALDTRERAANKLMRTFTSQMEALRKHRNGGNQKVVVEHVHVHRGGQAIVGNVTHGGRGGKGKGTQFHEQENLFVSAGAAVLGHIKANQVPLPGAGRAREERVPVSRRQGGRTEGKAKRSV